MSNQKRSQAILRMPIDMVDATLILHDGERADVLLFIPPTEDISRLVTEGSPFVTMVRGGIEYFVARAAVACLELPPDRAPQLDQELPIARKNARVKLRCGTIIEGELRWISPDGQQRTADALNVDVPYLVVHGAATTYLVLKAHVASVVEA